MHGEKVPQPTPLNVGFGTNYSNHTFLGADRNKAKSFTPQVVTGINSVHLICLRTLGGAAQSIRQGAMFSQSSYSKTRNVCTSRFILLVLVNVVLPT